MENTIDLGDGHTLSFLSWNPDRELNPQYAGIPDVEKFGATIQHTSPSGNICVGGIYFKSAVQQQVFPKATTWDAESWDPLTISPSVLCSCGDHGFIREGRWIRG